MNARDRKLLIAIRNECDARRGPCPRYLIPIAVNARGEHSVAMVDAQLNALERDGLIAEIDEVRGRGLRVTSTGLARLTGHHHADTPAASTAPEPPEIEPPAIESPETSAPLPDDDALLHEGYSLLLESSAALARHQRADVHLLSLYQRIERHCQRLWQRQEHKEATCDGH